MAWVIETLGENSRVPARFPEADTAGAEKQTELCFRPRAETAACCSLACLNFSLAFLPRSRLLPSAGLSTDGEQGRRERSEQRTRGAAGDAAGVWLHVSPLLLPLTSHQEAQPLGCPSLSDPGRSPPSHPAFLYASPTTRCLWNQWGRGHASMVFTEAP